MAGHICVGCGRRTRFSYGRWANQHPSAAAVMTNLATIIDQSDRHPTAALALAVPATLVALAAGAEGMTSDRPY